MHTKCTSHTLLAFSMNFVNSTPTETSLCSGFYFIFFRVNFIPVKSRYSTFSTTNHHILEIKVERGDPYELYETEFHEVPH